MKRAARFTFRFTLVIIVLFIAFLLIADRFVQFRMSDKEYSDYFSQKGLTSHIGYYKKDNRTIRYASSGNDTTTTILLIHGAPSP